MLVLVPLMLAAAAIEVGGVAAVIPFLSVLSDPSSLPSLPLVSGIIAARGSEDPVVLVRMTGLLLALDAQLATVAFLTLGLVCGGIYQLSMCARRHGVVPSLPSCTNRVPEPWPRRSCAS